MKTKRNRSGRKLSTIDSVAMDRVTGGLTEAEVRCQWEQRDRQRGYGPTAAGQDACNAAAGQQREYRPAPVIVNPRHTDPHWHRAGRPRPPRREFP